MDPFIVHGQKIVKLVDSGLSPGQAGLMLGWGVFTTLRLYGGEPFEFTRHWKRMEQDATRLNVPVDFDRATTAQLVSELARANHREEGMARVIFVRNSGGQWASEAIRPSTDLLIFTRELPVWPSAYSLQVQPAAVFSAGPFAGAKMLSWAANSAFMEKARAAGYDDALLLNERGELAECTSANLFVINSGRVATPPLSSGCLPGVTREVLLEVGSETGIAVSQEPLTLDSLDRAEEVFISSTTREVGAVKAVGERWKFTAPGPVTKAIAAAFRAYVRKRLQVPAPK
ncbi:MAG: aminotransferase class IV [Terriglobia bacterium]